MWLLAVAVAHATPDDRADLVSLFATVRARYAYLDPALSHLDAAEARLGPLAEAATSRDTFVPVLEQAIDTLVDFHAILGTNLPSSWRLVPSAADVWAEEKDGAVVVTEVRLGWPAERAHVHVGDHILAVGGVPTPDAIAAALPPDVTATAPRAREWALEEVLAGPHDQPRVWVVDDGTGPRTVHLDAQDDQPRPALVTSSRSGEVACVGVVVLHDLGDTASIAAFDAELDRLRDCRGLVVDLRDTAAGGSTRVAEPVLGRFIARRAPYQLMQPPGRRARLRPVRPRGPWRWDKPVVALVDHWTGSMGEGMAVGFDALGVPVVGTRMAGLRGAVEDFHLPHSGIRYTLPVWRLAHVDGTPREDWLPPHLSPTTGPGDPLLDAAAALLAGGGHRF